MKMRFVLAACLALLVAVSAAIVCVDAASAQECRIIRIMQDKSAVGTTIRLEPDTLQIAKGTCVIWVNWVPKMEVRINFREHGKKCVDATAASEDFKTAENCYLTDFLKLGATSSLRFTEAGTFDYEIEIPGERKSSAAGPLSVAFGEVKTAGKITVTE